MKSLAENREYCLSPPAIEWKGRWYSAHFVAGTYGTALVPDQDLPIAAIVWVEFVRPS